MTRKPTRESWLKISNRKTMTLNVRNHDEETNKVIMTKGNR
jgi:hypothetical protein